MRVRSYETVVVIDSKLEEAPLEEEISAIEGLITSNQGADPPQSSSTE